MSFSQTLLNVGLLLITGLSSIKARAIDTSEPVEVRSKAAICALRARLKSDHGVFGDCSSTLIEGDHNIDYLLTAAHCASSLEAFGAEYEFRYSCDFSGSKDKKNTKEWRLLELRQMIKHPLYSQPADPYDVALIPIQKVAKRAYIKIALDESDARNLVARSECLIAGFGPSRKLKSEKTFRTGRLLAGKVLFVGADVAQKDSLVHDHTFSAQARSGNFLLMRSQPTVARPGDSGGPVICRNANKEFKLVGVSNSVFSTADQEKILEEDSLSPSVVLHYTTAIRSDRLRTFLNSVIGISIP